MIKRPPPMRLPVLALFAVFLAACGGGGGGGDDVIPPFWLENGIALADLDNDGLADLVVARTYISGPPPHPGSIDVYLQTPSHTFGVPASYSVGSDPWNLTVGDVNGDGKPDIVVANSNSGDVSILLQNANEAGSFVPAQPVTTGGTPYAVAISDFNGDDYADLAVALQNTGGGAVVLLQNPAAPLSFQSPITLLNGTGATSVAAGDLNHDERPDIAVNGSTAMVFFQEATGGTFGPAVPLAAGIRPTAVVIEDIDTDGFNDLVVSNGGSSTDGSGASVSVLKQNSASPGNFIAAENYPVANGAQHLAVGQLLGTSGPDLAVISLVYSSLEEPSTVSILENQPAANFTVRQVLAGPFVGNFIAIGDINADGLADIVVNDGPQVYLQNSSSPGSFNPGMPLP